MRPNLLTSGLFALILAISAVLPGERVHAQATDSKGQVSSQQAAAPKGVLVLDWYNKDHLWNVRFDQSFRTALQSGAQDALEYYPEYLESDRFPGESQAELLRDYLRRKYASHRVNVVVANR